MPIGWRLLHLRTLTRENPNAPATSVLSDDELAVLNRIARTPLNPSRRDVLLAIAALGGHIKHNGEPGWQTLSHGWQFLLARVEGFRLNRIVQPACDQS
jgi:hypothetical protein